GPHGSWGARAASSRAPRTTPGRRRVARCTASNARHLRSHVEGVGRSGGQAARGRGGSIGVMVNATLKVSGVRCERCIGRLAGALRGHEGIEYANANLMGDVTLEWDDDKTSRDEIAAALSRSGFPEIAEERE